MAALNLPTDPKQLQRLKERFWKKVHKTDSCWLWWKAAPSGYGQLTVTRRTHGAHRISWVLHYGQIPRGLWVLHQCDVRLCVRPDHLFLGTHEDNMRDAASKGRMKPTYLGKIGEDHPAAKLTNKQVRRIRSLHAHGEKAKQIALKYNICETSVYRVVYGHRGGNGNWYHVK